MLSRELYEEALFETIRRGATVISPDVDAAFRRAIEKESRPAAKEGLRRTYESLLLSEKLDNPACPDTGWPVFYFRVGNECQLEGGMLGLTDAMRAAVRRATEAGYLRKTMKHPLTGFDPGDNIGENIPWPSCKFVPGDAIEMAYAAKGGGSECFGGTRHRVIAFADGVKGIEKFVIDSFVEATRSGGICPPNILGIGIGGTANVAANLAKEAACLRPVGSHHPDPLFRKIEEDLFEALNSLGVGVMGIGGDTSVLAVHVEYAYTHIAGICVDISANCMVARRAATRINADGSSEVLPYLNWFRDTRITGDTDQEGGAF
ncbi:MAG: fumarate hydratase [Lachnospiraceae bacterium]|nr:fumarate hydratase [Lachnospiraceae bacterium]